MDQKPKIRKRWIINPKTKVKGSKKTYKRAAVKNQLQKAAKEVRDEETT